MKSFIASALGRMGARGHGLLDHACNVAYLVNEVLTRKPQLSNARDEVVLAAVLHDIGKVEWPDRYFTSPYHALSKLDISIMQTHPIKSAVMAKRLGVSDTVADLIAQHHERPNKRGYPGQVDAPSIEALIIGACDVFAACLEPRPYREQSLTRRDALDAARMVGCPEIMGILQDTVFLDYDQASLGG